MSMMGRRMPQGREQVGETVASFATYEAAQAAVSSLIAGDVPARQIAIVGKGLRSIERVTGKLGYATAARSGAINGLLLGLFFAAIFVLGSPSPPIQAFAGVLLVGIAIGMLLSLVTYAFVRRRRDFASVMQVAADDYEVTVDDASVHRARQLLGAQAVAAPTGSGSTPQEAPREPPRYGERVDPAPEPVGEQPVPPAGGAVPPTPQPVPPSSGPVPPAAAPVPPLPDPAPPTGGLEHPAPPSGASAARETSGSA